MWIKYKVGHLNFSSTGCLISYCVFWKGSNGKHIGHAEKVGNFDFMTSYFDYQELIIDMKNHKNSENLPTNCWIFAVFSHRKWTPHRGPSFGIASSSWQCLCLMVTFKVWKKQEDYQRIKWLDVPGQVKLKVLPFSFLVKFY